MEETLIRVAEHMKSKLKTQKLKKKLENEYKFITNLLTICNVPNRIEKDDSDLYLLPFKNHNFKSPTFNNFKQANKFQIKEDLDDRLLKIKNKLKAPKKNNKSEKVLKRKEMKKLKKNKQIKKILISSQKFEKNETINTKNDDKNHSANDLNEDQKDIKPMKIFENNSNRQNKIFFSKIDFAPHPGAKIKKSKKEKVMKNPNDILKKLKETDKKIKEMKEMGEEDKARELKKELIWKKAFDKVQGKKVKDDRQLLYKSIKKKKTLKKKSKQNWKERQDKIKKDIASRQKKREDNIAKRKKDKNVNKLKKLSKKGRVISGF